MTSLKRCTLCGQFYYENHNCAVGSKRYRDPEWLRQKYWTEKKTLAEMAQICGTHAPTILRWMKKHRIPRRANTEHMNGESHPNWKPKVLVFCSWCGKTFKRSPSLVNEHNFCCKEHQIKWLAENNKTGQMITCDYCGKEFYRCSGHISRYREENFCSISCSMKYQWEQDNVYSHLSTKFRGEGNSAWKGGHKYYYGPNWEEQRRKALERDNYRCQLCGAKENLHVHHIVPYREFGRRHKLANRLENLITLCRKHHGKAERGVINLEVAPEVTLIAFQ